MCIWQFIGVSLNYKEEENSSLPKTILEKEVPWIRKRIFRKGREHFSKTVTLRRELYLDIFKRHLMLWDSMKMEVGSIWQPPSIFKPFIFTSIIEAIPKNPGWDLQQTYLNKPHVHGAIYVYISSCTTEITLFAISTSSDLISRWNKVKKRWLSFKKIYYFLLVLKLNDLLLKYILMNHP